MPGGILIVGCGDLGSEVGRLLAARGHTVHGARRQPHGLPPGITPLALDVTAPASLQQLAALAPEIVLYSVAAPQGTDEAYRQSYPDGLAAVLAALPPPGAPRHVFFVSSTRVYGNDAHTLQDEDTPPRPEDFRGRRLLQAEAALRDSGRPHTVLRLSGIYGPGRERLLRLAAAPQQWPPYNSWTNRIHRDDAAGFIVHLTERVLAGAPVADCYLVTDHLPAPMYDVLQWLRQQLEPASAPVALAPPAGGKRLGNRRLRASGYALAYPDYRAGYASLLRQR